MNKRRKKLLWIAPLALIGMIVFIAIGGTVVMLLWNWLAPALFGLRQIGLWQAIGLLAICRILFGGFGGGCHRRSHRRRPEGWDRMTPEERERFRQGGERSAQTRPLGDPGTEPVR
ncbi:MAG TPA: hypothetical protein VJT50_13370 [Pyrinomonadaceae bacterium]|nr:hypothetical protein [Pyrinomonadaceae bacterium]